MPTASIPACEQPMFEPKAPTCESSRVCAAVAALRSSAGEGMEARMADALAAADRHTLDDPSAIERSAQALERLREQDADGTVLFRDGASAALAAGLGVRG